jgi:DNA-binding transcriptional ArsR family regulator
MSSTTTTPINSALYALRAKFYRGLADPSRLAILEALQAGPQTVGEIVATTGLNQPNTSNHLACLLDCGLVTREKQGKYGVYSLADGRIASLLNLADDVVADVAARIYSCTRYGMRDEERP